MCLEFTSKMSTHFSFADGACMYKIFYRQDNSEELMGLFVPDRYKVGETYVSTSDIINAVFDDPYPAGFHCLRTLKDVFSYMPDHFGPQRPQRRVLVIASVFVQKLLAWGLQSKTHVLVFNKMQITGIVAEGEAVYAASDIWQFNGMKSSPCLPVDEVKEKIKLATKANLPLPDWTRLLKE